MSSSSCVRDLARGAEHTADGRDDGAQHQGDEGPQRSPGNRVRGHLRRLQSLLLRLLVALLPLRQPLFGFRTGHSGMLSQRIDRRLTIGLGQIFRSGGDRLLYHLAHGLVARDLLYLLAGLLSLLSRLPEELLEVLLERREHTRRLGGACSLLCALTRSLHGRADDTKRTADQVAHRGGKKINQ